MKTLLTLLFNGLLVVNVMAAVHYDISDPDVVAQVDDLILSPQVIDIFWQAYNHPSRPITPPQAMQRIVDEALLAQHARAVLADSQLNQENKVGFLKQVEQQDRATALLRKFFEKPLYNAIQNLPGKSLDGIYQFNDDVNITWLKKHFVLESKLRVEATPEQIQLAKNTTLASVTLSSGAQTSLTQTSEETEKSIKILSLWDIYQRLNVQGRVAVHNGDLNFLKAQVRQHVGSLFVLFWAQSNMAEQDYQAVFQIVMNESDKTTLMKNLGLHTDIHNDNPVLREKAKQVSEEEILAFYNEHKEEFRVIEKVKARHLQLTSQQQADDVYQEIKRGLSFEAAVLKYSVADDKSKQPAGNLGWLKRNDKQRSWLHSVAFTQPAGKVSVPFRSPQNAGAIVYEILYIDERVEGYLPVTDPTVNYEASRDIALKKLKRNFSILQAELRKNAHIRLNQSLKGNGR
ncbi:peptidylprolyl isomerase [Bacterioplanoides sp. SCSIO 12839]|uniref:peptidylprolyl isomerase n=1 Tax=Bacterioplanoides sp. SCSIO 12839 TaxID=2829569 RepID=UPI002103FDA0|nr:peptidylprolyl isomerase [Bacterioplanoides sp. SCSIO 12839]UTW47632.1 peptidylprolyl isomerase [Bacterioplanoides sp. SCSIO 12839]